MHKNKKNLKWLRHLPALLALLSACLSPAWLQAAPAAANFLANDINATNQIIVRLRPHTLLTDRLHQRLGQLAGENLAYQRSAANDVSIYRLPAHMPLPYVRRLAVKLAGDPNVLYAEPDLKLHLLPPQTRLQPAVADRLLRAGAGLPNDPFFPQQWDLSAGPGGINAPAAWHITTGSSQIVTAVVDSGARFEHEDLRGRLIAGYNFSEHNFSPVDPGAVEQGQVFYHGTNIAGVIGAAANNGRGIAGINWVSKVLIVRMAEDANTSLYLSDASEAVRWAAGLSVPGAPANPTPARVLNLSWGITNGGCPQTFVNTLNAVRAKGAVVVVATGNDGIDAGNDFPTSCPGVISAAALDHNGNRASFSDYGNNITIGAPGEGILLAGDTRMPPAGDSYTVGDGTSFAAPHVAGVISLMLSVNPGLSPDAVTRLLKQSARPFPTGANCNGICQAGMLDAGRAVALASNQGGAPSAASQTLHLLISRAQVAHPGARVNLIGMGLTTPGAHIVSYLWRQVGGPPAPLSNPRVARPSFIAPRMPAALVFHLTITDSLNRSVGAATLVRVVNN